VLVCAWLLTAGGCAQSSPPAVQIKAQPFDYETRMGLARWQDPRGCLAVFYPAVAPGTKVALVYEPGSPESPSVKEAIVAERLSQDCEQGLAGPNDQGIAPSFYRIATADGTAPPTGIVFAILNPPGPVVVRDGHVEADLDGDGAKESFRVCNSSENVHFLVWTGSPAEGRLRWRGHFYVGYDMTPSCTEQDVAGMVALDKRKKSGK
jgi:hypothetical protein